MLVLHNYVQALPLNFFNPIKILANHSYQGYNGPIIFCYFNARNFLLLLSIFFPSSLLFSLRAAVRPKFTSPCCSKSFSIEEARDFRVGNGFFGSLFLPFGQPFAASVVPQTKGIAHRLFTGCFARLLATGQTTVGGRTHKQTRKTTACAIAGTGKKSVAIGTHAAWGPQHS